MLSLSARTPKLPEGIEHRILQKRTASGHGKKEGIISEDQMFDPSIGLGRRSMTDPLVSAGTQK